MGAWRTDGRLRNPHRYRMPPSGCLFPAARSSCPFPTACPARPVSPGCRGGCPGRFSRGVFPGAFVCRSGSLRSDALLPVAAVCVWADRRRERQGRACRAGPFPKRHPHEKGAAGDRLPLVRQWWGAADYFVSSFSGRMTTFTSLPSSSTFLAMACTSALVSVWSVCS